MPEQSAHGGKRTGSGRKPLPGGSVTVAYVLTPAHLEAIARWQQQHGCTSASEALRQMIDAASR